jgi:hypothetical protein
MLSVLGFKRSLFAGVLDGGEREVFLGGSRLTRFMESVERVTAGISAPVVEGPAEPAAAAPAATEDRIIDGDGDVMAAEARPAGLQPGVTPDQVGEAMGFEFLMADRVGATAPPALEELAVLGKLDPARRFLV